MQRSGAGSRGDEGPKAPMVLGTKIRRQFSKARSRTLWRPEQKNKAVGIKRFLERALPMVTVCFYHVSIPGHCQKNRPVMLILRASATLASPTALRRAL